MKVNIYNLPKEMGDNYIYDNELYIVKDIYDDAGIKCDSIEEALLNSNDFKKALVINDLNGGHYIVDTIHLDKCEFYIATSNDFLVFNHQDNTWKSFVTGKSHTGQIPRKGVFHLFIEDTPLVTTKWCSVANMDVILDKFFLYKKGELEINKEIPTLILTEDNLEEACKRINDFVRENKITDSYVQWNENNQSNVNRWHSYKNFCFIPDWALDSPRLNLKFLSDTHSHCIYTGSIICFYDGYFTVEKNKDTVFTDKYLNPVEFYGNF